MSSALPILKTYFETDCPEVEKDEGPALFGVLAFPVSPPTAGNRNQSKQFSRRVLYEIDNSAA